VNRSNRLTDCGCIFLYYSGIKARQFISNVSSSNCGMSNHSSVDQETFQQLLANAFAVQESQINSQSLSAVMEVQRMLRNGDLDVDGAMDRLVECARNAANATGVAVALLKGGQLTYRSGTGSAATYVGRQVTASLTVSADTERRREILRVEDAQTDTRIEGAICRQFGAQSLLILPIYDVRGLAGVLEVLFSEAHVFQHGEVRTYQLIARQIEAAIVQAAALEQKARQATQPPITSPAVAEVTGQQQGYLNNPRSIDDPFPTNYSQRHGARLVAVGEFLRNRSAMLANTIRVATDVLWRDRQWRLALAVVTVAISVTCWIAYHERRPVSSLEPSSRPTSTVIDPQARGRSIEALPEKATTLVERSVKPTTQKVRRVKVGWNEVDYGEDVTVRYFTSSPTPQRKPTSNGRVVYIGEDVTVRYFAPTPAQRPGRQ
jgi:GAF domain-containing protein